MAIRYLLGGEFRGNLLSGNAMLTTTATAV